MSRDPIEPVEGIRLHPLRTVLTDWRTYVFVPVTIALLWGVLTITP